MRKAAELLPRRVGTSVPQGPPRTPGVPQPEAGGVSGVEVPLTFEAVDAGPPAASVPYPVQALSQLHDAKLVAGASQLLQGPGLLPTITPALVPSERLLEVLLRWISSARLSFMHEPVEPDAPAPAGLRTSTAC